MVDSAKVSIGYWATFAVSEQLQSLFEFCGREVLLVPTLLKAFLQIGEAVHRLRDCGVLGFVGGVVRGEGRVGLRDIVVVSEHEQLGSPVCRHTLSQRLARYRLP